MSVSANKQHGGLLVDDVSKHFGDKYNSMPVVERCRLTAQRGKFTVVVGPSGAGKSTLIDMMAGYLEPSAGRILLDGQEVKGPGWDRLVVFQETALFPWMTTLKNVMYGPLVQGEMSNKEVRDKATDLLNRFGLDGFGHKYPSQLSGGMQRRCEIARAVINDPKVLLMDEPFRGLDAMSRELMQEYITELFEGSGRTILFVTTEIDEAIFLADYLVILSRGPATTKKVLSVDLPRPRRFEVRGTERYRQLKETALDALYEEAARAFEGTAVGNDIAEAYSRRRKNPHESA